MIYAVGDIHGMWYPLLDLMDNIKTHASRHEESHTIIFLGDYIDRGGKEFEVVNFLNRDPPDNFKYVLIRGNHEDMAIKTFQGYKYFKMWYTNGGETTIKSFGSDKDKIESGYSIPILADFIRKTKIYHRVGKFFFVHAGIRPLRLLKNQTDSDMMWIREEFLNHEGPYAEDIIMVHGHTPVQYDPNYRSQMMPVKTDYRINVDTGSVWTQKISAAIIDNGGNELKGFLQS